MQRKHLILALLLALSTTLVACQKEEGPMEKMGKKADEAAQDVADSVEDVADDVEDAAEDTEEKLEGDS